MYEIPLPVRHTINMRASDDKIKSGPNQIFKGI